MIITGATKYLIPLSNVNSISWTDMTASVEPRQAQLDRQRCFKTETPFPDVLTDQPSFLYQMDSLLMITVPHCRHCYLMKERSSCMALAIGDDADKRVLQEFLADAENNRVFEVYEEKDQRLLSVGHHECV